MSSAASRDADLVLVDTAGRLHTKTNLMAELEKLSASSTARRARSRRCCSCSMPPPGRTDSRRPAQFAEAVDVTGVVLTKLDGTAKGGIVLAIEAELGIPVKLIGVGGARRRPRRVRPRSLRRCPPRRIAHCFGVTPTVHFTVQ